MHAKASMAKLFVSEAANRCADRCLQIWGGRGYTRDQRRRALLARAARGPHLGGHERDPAADRRPRAGAPRRRAGAPVNLKVPGTFIFAPRSVAVVGASERAGSYGGEVLLNLERLGFGGRVFAVNPRRSSVHGVAAVPSLGRPAGGARTRSSSRCPRPTRPTSSRRRRARLRRRGRVRGGLRRGARRRAAGAAGRGRAATMPVCGPNGNGIVSLPDRVALWGDPIRPRRARPGRADLPERQRRGQRAGLAPRAAAAHGRLVRQPGGARRRRTSSRAVARARRRALDRALPRGRRRRRALVRGARALRARRRRASRCSKAGSSRAGAAAARGAHRRDRRRPARLPRPVRGVRRGLGARTRTTCSSSPRRSRRVRARARARLGAAASARHDVLGRRLRRRRRSRRASSASTCRALAPATLEARLARRPARGRGDAPRNPLDYTSLLWDEPGALRRADRGARRRPGRRPRARALRRLRRARADPRRGARPREVADAARLDAARAASPERRRSPGCREPRCSRAKALATLRARPPTRIAEIARRRGGAARRRLARGARRQGAAARGGRPRARAAGRVSADDAVAPSGASSPDRWR